MKHFKKLVSIYINSSIHVALAVVAFTYITAIETALYLPTYLVFFLFFASITGYNFVKYAGIAQLHHRSLTANLRLIQVFSFIAFILMLYFGWQLSQFTWLMLVPLGLLNLFYAVPIFFKAKNLRSIPLLKVVVIALVWSGVSVYIPFVETYTEITVETHLYALQRFLLVFCLMIPFEIRDIRFDLKSVKTLPQVVGIQSTKWIGGIMLLSGCALNFFLLEKNYLYIYVLIACIVFLFIRFSKVYQNRYYASLWVEGIPILYLILLILFN